jgi:hypothetical protein
VLALFGAFLFATRSLSSTQRLQLPAFIPGYTIAIFSDPDNYGRFALYTILGRPHARAPGLGDRLSVYGIYGGPVDAHIPGVFTPETLMGGLQSPAYIYVLRHAGFPAFVICYALLKDPGPGKHAYSARSVHSTMNGRRD